MSQKNPKRSKRKFFLVLLALIVIVVAIVVALYWAFVGRFYQSTDDAYVQGNEVEVSARINSHVTQVFADDHDLVMQGDVILALDDADTQQALAQAQANLKHTLRETKALYASVSRLKTTYQQAQRDFARAQKLYKSDGISTQEFQHEKAQRDSARASLNETLAHTENTSIKKHPQVKLAISKLKKAWLANERTKVRAPVTGYVAQRHAHVGQSVQPGQALLAVVPLNHLWIDANFKETKIDRIRIGQPVEVNADVYGSSYTYHGKVEGISAGTGSAFSLLPPQNATGNWIKIVQRVPVRISLDSKELAEKPLRIGLSTDVTIDTHDEDGKVLSQVPASKPIYSTDIYRQHNDDFQQLVDKILADY